MVMNTGVLAMLRIIPILTRARCGSGAAAGALATRAAAAPAGAVAARATAEDDAPLNARTPARTRSSRPLDADTEHLPRRPATSGRATSLGRAPRPGGAGARLVRLHYHERARARAALEATGTPSGTRWTVRREERRTLREARLDEVGGPLLVDTEQRALRRAEDLVWAQGELGARAQAQVLPAVGEAHRGVVGHLEPSVAERCTRNRLQAVGQAAVAADPDAQRRIPHRDVPAPRDVDHHPRRQRRADALLAVEAYRVEVEVLAKLLRLLGAARQRLVVGARGEDRIPAGRVALQVDDRRAVDEVEAVELDAPPVHAEQAGGGEAEGVRPAGVAQAEHAAPAAARAGVAAGRL